MSLTNKIKTKLFCNKIGIDEFGNSYWEEKVIPEDGQKKRRYVIYNGISEPSKIPSEWHGWIHYTSNTIPINIDTHKYSWQKIHLPNLTGTKYAYHPSDNSPKDEDRKKVSSDYQPYNPK